MNSKKLKQLEVKWARKLKQSGFKDIESADRQYLNTWDSRWFANRRDVDNNPSVRFTQNAESRQVQNLDYYKGKQEYFYLAGHFLSGFEFANKREKEFWKKHSEGFSNREIAKKHRCSKDIVNMVIRRLKKEMLRWNS